MASLKDTPTIIRKMGFIPFCKVIWSEIAKDNIFTWAAALAYAWLFAIFPFIVFLLGLLPLVPQQLKANVQDDLAVSLQKSLPGDSSALILKQITDLLSKPNAGGFISFGLLLTIWAASSGMSMTMAALDRAYDVKEPRSYLRQRLIAIALTIVVATMLILVMALMPIGTAILYWLIAHGKIFGWAFQLVNYARYAIAFVLLFSILAIVYHYGPGYQRKFQAVSAGALFCITVWLLLGWAFRVYLTSFGGAASYDRTYGAVAGVAILLLFFYVDALVLLIGAEINSELDTAAERLSVAKGPEEKDTSDHVDSPAVSESVQRSSL